MGVGDEYRSIHPDFPRIVQLRKSGLTHLAIAKQIGRSREWVSRLFSDARDMGINEPPRPPASPSVTAALNRARKIKTDAARLASMKIDTEILRRVQSESVLSVAVSLGVSDGRILRVINRRSGNTSKRRNPRPSRIDHYEPREIF